MGQPLLQPLVLGQQTLRLAAPPVLVRIAVRLAAQQLLAALVWVAMLIPWAGLPIPLPVAALQIFWVTVVMPVRAGRAEAEETEHITVPVAKVVLVWRLLGSSPLIFLVVAVAVAHGVATACRMDLVRQMVAMVEVVDTGSQDLFPVVVARMVVPMD